MICEQDVGRDGGTPSKSEATGQFSGAGSGTSGQPSLPQKEKSCHNIRPQDMCTHSDQGQIGRYHVSFAIISYKLLAQFMLQLNNFDVDSSLSYNSNFNLVKIFIRHSNCKNNLFIKKKKFWFYFILIFVVQFKVNWDFC